MTQESSPLTLAVVEQAIVDILTLGKTVQIGDRMYSHENLDRLQSLRDTLKAGANANKHRMFVRVSLNRVSG